jgi:hypothetical protein
MGKSTKPPPPKRALERLQISVTLADNRKELMVFKECEDYQQIARKIMDKYAIPSQKLRNIENIIQNKLGEKRS